MSFNLGTKFKRLGERKRRGREKQEKERGREQKMVQKKNV